MQNKPTLLCRRHEKGQGMAPLLPEMPRRYEQPVVLLQAQRRGIFRFPDKWTLSPTAPTPLPRSKTSSSGSHLSPAGQPSPTTQKQHPNTPNTPQSPHNNNKQKQHHKEKHQTPSRATEPSRANNKMLKWKRTDPLATFLPPCRVRVYKTSIFGPWCRNSVGR